MTIALIALLGANPVRGEEPAIDATQQRGGTAEPLGDIAPPIELPSPRVRAAQKYLGELGLYDGPRNGKLGERTDKALRSFRQRYKLPPASGLDDATLARLRRLALAAAKKKQQLAQPTTSPASALPQIKAAPTTSAPSPIAVQAPAPTPVERPAAAAPDRLAGRFPVFFILISGVGAAVATIAVLASIRLRRPRKASGSSQRGLAADGAYIPRKTYDDILRRYALADGQSDRPLRITGGAGSGKSAMLNAFASELAPFDADPRTGKITIPVIVRIGSAGERITDARRLWPEVLRAVVTKVNEATPRHQGFAAFQRLYEHGISTVPTQKQLESRLQKGFFIAISFAALGAVFILNVILSDRLGPWIEATKSLEPSLASYIDWALPLLKLLPSLLAASGFAFAAQRKLLTEAYAHITTRKVLAQHSINLARIPDAETFADRLAQGLSLPDNNLYRDWSLLIDVFKTEAAAWAAKSGSRYRIALLLDLDGYPPADLTVVARDGLKSLFEPEKPAAGSDLRVVMACGRTDGSAGGTGADAGLAAPVIVQDMSEDEAMALVRLRLATADVGRTDRTGEDLLSACLSTANPLGRGIIRLLATGSSTEEATMTPVDILERCSLFLSDFASSRPERRIELELRRVEAALGSDAAAERARAHLFDFVADPHLRSRVQATADLLSVFGGLYQNDFSSGAWPNLPSDRYVPIGEFARGFDAVVLDASGALRLREEFARTLQKGERNVRSARDQLLRWALEHFLPAWSASSPPRKTRAAALSLRCLQEPEGFVQMLLSPDRRKLADLYHWIADAGTVDRGSAARSQPLLESAAFASTRLLANAGFISRAACLLSEEQLRIFVATIPRFFRMLEESGQSISETPRMEQALWLAAAELTGVPDDIADRLFGRPTRELLSRTRRDILEFLDADSGALRRPTRPPHAVILDKLQMLDRLPPPERLIVGSLLHNERARTGIEEKRKLLNALYEIDARHFGDEEDVVAYMSLLRKVVNSSIFDIVNSKEGTVDGAKPPFLAAQEELRRLVDRLRAIPSARGDKLDLVCWADWEIVRACRIWFAERQAIGGGKVAPVRDEFEPVFNRSLNAIGIAFPSITNRRRSAIVEKLHEELTDHGGTDLLFQMIAKLLRSRLRKGVPIRPKAEECRLVEFAIHRSRSRPEARLLHLTYSKVMLDGIMATLHSEALDERKQSQLLRYFFPVVSLSSLHDSDLETREVCARVRALYARLVNDGLWHRQYARGRGPFQDHLTDARLRDVLEVSNSAPGDFFQKILAVLSCSNPSERDVSGGMFIVARIEDGTAVGLVARVDGWSAPLNVPWNNCEPRIAAAFSPTAPQSDKSEAERLRLRGRYLLLTVPTAPSGGAQPGALRVTCRGIDHVRMCLHLFFPMKMRWDLVDQQAAAVSPGFLKEMALKSPPDDLWTSRDCYAWRVSESDRRKFSTNGYYFMRELREGLLVRGLYMFSACDKDDLDRLGPKEFDREEIRRFVRGVFSDVKVGFDKADGQVVFSWDAKTGPPPHPHHDPRMRALLGLFRQVVGLRCRLNGWGEAQERRLEDAA